MTSESADTPPAGPREAVAGALAGLDGLERRPTPAHVAAFERVHTALTEALATIDGA